MEVLREPCAVFSAARPYRAKDVRELELSVYQWGRRMGNPIKLLDCTL
jgi:hypothetical protein